MNAIVPVYYQIKQRLKERIINGEFGLSEKIPSENQFAKEFNVSRLTVRQATSQLIQEGFLRASRGKGTFVTNDKSLIESFSLEFTGFMDDLFYHVSKTKTKTVEISRTKIPKHISDKVKFHQDPEEITLIKRIRFKGDKCIAYTINYLPLEFGERIKEEDLLKKPLLQIMEQDLGVKFAEAFQTIEASFADQEIALKLGVASGVPILLVERTMYTKNRKPVEFVKSYYRGDLYKYIVRLKNVRRKQVSVWVHQTE